jgi:hypothetical protein
LRALAVCRSDKALEERLRADLHDQVAVDRVGELSGEAFFMSVRGLSSSGLYESVQPVVAIWKQLLELQALPYDVDEAGPASTDGIELYEISDDAVEVATQSYGGEEEGVAALIHGATSRLRCAGLSFQIECWSI